jgi:CheY-like chemotaxis protein
MRVTVADDSGLYRDLLARTLTEAGHEVNTAATAMELMTVADTTAPDIVLTDIRMPPRHTDDGLRAGLRLRERHPGWAWSCCPTTAKWRTPCNW